MFKHIGFTNISYSNQIKISCNRESYHNGIYTIQRTRPFTNYKITYRGYSKNILHLWIGDSDCNNINILAKKSLMASMECNDYVVYIKTENQSKISIGFSISNDAIYPTEFILT